MAQEKLQTGQQIVIGGGFRNGTRAIQLTRGHCEDLSAHEEADSRLLLHAAHASKDHKRLVIQSPDTDVVVLCTAHFSEIGSQELWFRTGVKDKLRYIPIHKLAVDLGPTICDALLPFHALTGCDSTSSFAGTGKKRPFKMLCENVSERCLQVGDGCNTHCRYYFSI